MLPLQDFSFDQIASGALNPISDNRSTSLLVAADPNNPLDSIFKYVESALHDSARITNKVKWTAMVLRNDTSPHPDETPYGVLRETSFDPAIRASGEMSSRGCVRILIPELHSHLPRPSAIADWEYPNPADMAITELYPRAYGPAEYLRGFVGGELVEVEFVNPGTFNEATIILPAGAAPPDPTKVQNSKGKATSARKAMNRPATRATTRSPNTKPTPGNPLKRINKVGRQTLALPAPKARPSAKAVGKYHTSVNKELLKGPSPYGDIDWTGCGGFGTCLQSHGKPAKGRKGYYLKKDSPLLVTLPKGYAQYNWVDGKLKCHRAAIEPYMAMVAAARADGIPYPIFTCYSTWRSLKQQDASFKRYFYKTYGGSKKWPMRSKQNRKAYKACRKYNSDPFGKKNPGGDHYCGRGFDMFLGFVQNHWSKAYQDTHKVSRIKANQAYKKYMHTLNVFKWLMINAEFFGFYNYSLEPWHWCFNPDDRAGRSDTRPEFPE